MFSRLTYLGRRCPQRRLYSVELGSDVSKSNEVKENFKTPEKAVQETDASRVHIDRRLQLQRLQNNFAHPGPGLKSPKNRSDLAAEFFDLSKSVIDGRLTVEELEKSKIIQSLDEQLNFYIDIMNNSQVVNMLASLVKMRFDFSSNMVRLLEHEVKFRINSLTLLQVMKLMKFYNSIEASFEQKQLVDILNNRLRSNLLSNKSSLRELLEIYHHLAEQVSQTNMLGLTEEKMLSLLAGLEQDGDDDIVSRYLPKTTSYDYESLCNIFTELAAVKRRPSPLLKATSKALFKTVLPEVPPSHSVLIHTLNALVSLNYTSRPLVSKLVDDLTNTLSLSDLDPATQCNLLRIVGSLKWRSDKLLNQYYEHIKTHQDNLQKADHNLILTLFHVVAHLNYKIEGDLDKFYQSCMQNSRESMIDRRSRKWLNYVWSLAVLNLATDEHYASVINDEFIKAIENPLGLQKVNYSDVMKLLNLRALALTEGKFSVTHSQLLDELANTIMQRGSDMQKFASKMKEALTGIVENSENLSFEKHTPFGFTVDCLLDVDEHSKIYAVNNQDVDFQTSLTSNGRVKNSDTSSKVALIYILFDEALASHPSEPIGHKKVISRILKNLGFRTVYIQEGMLNRYKTSSELSIKVQEIIKGTNENEPNRPGT